VHVFSASYSSFLLAPLPPCSSRARSWRTGRAQLRSGRRPIHLRRSAIARTAIARVDQQRGSLGFLSMYFAGSGSTRRRAEHRRSRSLSLPRAESAPASSGVHRISMRCTTWHDDPRVPVGPGSLARCIVDVVAAAQEASLRALVRELDLRQCDLRRSRRPDEIAGFYAVKRHLRQSPDIDKHAHVRSRGVRERLPVVSTARRWLAAHLTDGEHGLSARSADFGLLAACVLRLLPIRNAPRMARAAFRPARVHLAGGIRLQWWQRTGLSHAGRRASVNYSVSTASWQSRS
jgi:hypothetical protein